MGSREHDIRSAKSTADHGHLAEGPDRPELALVESEMPIGRNTDVFGSDALTGIQVAAVRVADIAGEVRSA